MSTQILVIILVTVILLLVIELIRKEKLTFKYAAGWISVCLLAIGCAVFKKFIFQMAEFFGFELTSNFIFFALLSIFVFLTLLLTIFLCEQNSRNDQMTQKMGILEYEIKQLKEDIKKLISSNGHKK